MANTAKETRRTVEFDGGSKRPTLRSFAQQVPRVATVRIADGTEAAQVDREAGEARVKVEERQRYAYVRDEARLMR